MFQSYAFGTKTTLVVLMQDYQEFNEDYFLGQLPKDTRITMGDLSHEMGNTTVDGDGRWHITIDRESNPVERQAELTLLHEQCHIYIHVTKQDEKPDFDPHGKQFQGCMLDLAHHGAFRLLW